MPRALSMAAVNAMHSKPLKFVASKNVDFLFGKQAQVPPRILSAILDEALDNINQGYSLTESRRGRFKEDPKTVEYLTGSMDALLRDNRETKANSWDLCQDFDFDITLEYQRDASGNGGSMRSYVHPFFKAPDFQRPKAQTRVVLRLLIKTYQGSRWGIAIPLQLILKGMRFTSDCHFGYGHQIYLHGAHREARQLQYLGVTKRNWLTRMAEHFREVESGGNKTFHKAWRDFAGGQDVDLTSELIVHNHSYEQIMAWEEEQVDACVASGTSLNMIPGGFKGMRFLHEHRLTQGRRVSLKERDRAIELFQRDNPRHGIPNLIVSNLWKKEEYAIRVICGPEGRLSVDQVLKIRRLGREGGNIDEITELVGARNRDQVKRVLEGRTYARVGASALPNP